MSKHTQKPWMPTDADMRLVGGGRTEREDTFISAAKRVNLVRHEPEGDWDWWVGHGKDESCQIEGTPCHWFWLAYILLGLVDPKDSPYSEDKPLPFSSERVRSCVQAMDGIDDPAAFVEAVKKVVGAYEANYRDTGATLRAACGLLANAVKVKEVKREDQSTPESR